MCNQRKQGIVKGLHLIHHKDTQQNVVTKSNPGLIWKKTMTGPIFLDTNTEVTSVNL